MNCEFKRKLPIPMELKAQYPISAQMEQVKAERDAQIASVFNGKSDKFLLIIGPCSADNEDAVLDYTTRLAKLAQRVSDKLLIIPRVYTNKPRTTGEGYKGMLHQPDPSLAPDMLLGLVKTRRLHMRVVNETGLTCADEMLYPENHRYFSDLLSYVSVGARSVEDQQHRLTASALNIPVGFKNSTSGDTTAMLNALIAARHSHTFIYRGWEVESTGNTLAHLVLRGGCLPNGKNKPNFGFEHLCRLYSDCKSVQISSPSVIVDASHANSGKNYINQPDICLDVINSKKQDGKINGFVKGLMVESYLEDGAQQPGGTVYGKSITDSCLGWQKTEKLILTLADLL